VPGAGVRYDFTGLGSTGTGLSDAYPVLLVYGQNGNGDFSNFEGYKVTFINVSASGYVHVNIFINTGSTSGTDGGHAHSGACDTFWENSWTYLPAGASVDLTLDFAGATAWNVSDNPSPHSEGGNGSPDGGTYTINAYDRTQVTRIGFQVVDFSGTNPSASLIVRLYEAPVATEATTWGAIKALYHR
jgi:hypothetical protein